MTEVCTIEYDKGPLGLLTDRILWIFISDAFNFTGSSGGEDRPFGHFLVSIKNICQLFVSYLCPTQYTIWYRCTLPVLFTIPEGPSPKYTEQ